MSLSVAMTTNLAFSSVDEKMVALSRQTGPRSCLPLPHFLGSQLSNEHEHVVAFEKELCDVVGVIARWGDWLLE